ncbi:MAG: RNA polymerase-binding protein DksA [Xanthomonadales bacterium]|nr:RNA polymerase-binding protein DksA [Xanthomonadales bacterium]
MAKTPAKSKTKSASKAKPAAKSAAKSASKAASKAKPAAKKPAAKPAPAKKSAASKQAPAKKAASKPVAARKPAGKPVVAKKSPAKTPAGKTPPAKSTPAKPTAKPAAAKKPAAAAPVAPARTAGPGKAAQGKVAQARAASVEPVRTPARPAAPARPAVVATARVGRASRPSDELPTPTRKREVAAGPVKLPSGYRPLASEEYMSPRQVEYFRQKLLTWRADLIEESKQTIDNLRDEVRDVGDEAERAARETENSLELRTRDRYRKLLAQIDKALKRIEDGEYGYCEETGEPIGIERLEVRPIARFSIDAQERWELRQKHMGE